MEGARGEHQVDARPARAGERMTGRLDVLAARARKAGHDRPADGGRNGADTLEISRRCPGEAGLDHVDAQALELLGDLRLLMRLQRDAR